MKAITAPRLYRYQLRALRTLQTWMARHPHATNAIIVAEFAGVILAALYGA